MYNILLLTKHAVFGQAIGRCRNKLYWKWPTWPICPIRLGFYRKSTDVVRRFDILILPSQTPLR